MVDFDDQLYWKIRKELLSEHHKIFLDVAFNTGLSFLEITNLRVTDIQNNSSPFSLIRSGRKEIPIDEQLENSLKVFCSHSNSIWLFPSPSSRDLHLSPRTLTHSFQKALVRAGLRFSGITPKDIRRAFLRRLISKGTYISSIQKCTGLSSFTILRYCKEYDLECFPSYGR